MINHCLKANTAMIDVGEEVKHIENIEDLKAKVSVKNKEENLEDLKWSYPKSLFNKLLMVMIDKYIL